MTGRLDVTVGAGLRRGRLTAKHVELMASRIAEPLRRIRWGSAARLVNIVRGQRYGPQ
jgi:hypothetical protein